MRYIEDSNLEYRDILVKHLREHNKKYTGNKEFSSKCFYAVDGDELVGAINTTLAWDWVDIGDSFYKDLNIASKMLSQIHSYYEDRAVGLKLITEIEPRVEEFQGLGFDLLGAMEGTNKTKKSYHLKCVGFNQASSSGANVIIEDEPIPEYDLLLQEQVEKMNTSNGIQDLQYENITFIALDDAHFAGGIQVSICADSMYINRLVVSEEYRRKQVGSKLMNLIEDKARELDVYSISTGTAEFQARGFYEKLGYKVVMIKENDPKGYNSYKMTKKM